MNDDRKSDKDKKKKVMASFMPLMRTELNDYAGSLGTCCIHNLPLFLASTAPPDVLHLDLNIFSKVLDEILTKSKQLTLDHSFCDFTFTKKSEVLPALEYCTEDAPMKKFVEVFEQAGQNKLARFYRKGYTSMNFKTANEDGETVCDDANEQDKLRLIGATVTAVSVDCLVPLLGCLDLPSSYKMTKQQKKDQLICATYTHLVRCLSANFRNILLEVGVDDVGIGVVCNLFTKLVYRYGLGGSFNDFQIGKAAKFYIDILVQDFRLDERWALGLALFNVEGGESNNHLCKQQSFTLTNRAKGWTRSLLLQRLQIYVGEILSDKFELEDYNVFDPVHEKNAWAKRFGPDKKGTNVCHICNSECSEVKTLSEFAQTFKGHGALVNFIISHTVDKLPLLMIFKRHLRMDAEANSCKTCTSVYLFLIALHQNVDNSVAWLK